MAIELRGVHALNQSHAALVLAFVLDATGVFEDIRALGQVADEEVASGVFGRLVVAEAVLVFVAGEDVDGFGAAAPLVLHVDVLHVSIDTKDDAGDEFVANREGASHWLELGALLGIYLGVKGFL